eukprot:TRINITY_DN7097_c0_g1_i1.p1 TRINITY_DN7097_c0_g1~~TRINITY_DN7097_c0_g1_i1.p1  ORF type:complete len:492 (+),score=69.74 TRINITY_DN7097_c0_g1_i1:58-1533(+)
MSAKIFALALLRLAIISQAQIWNEQAILTASNKLEQDWFGKSVSMTSDYILVGASQASPELIYRAGAAYIFIRSGISWIEQAILTASNKNEQAWFGNSVSITDTFALVGAPRASVESVLTGAAYLFSRSGTAWNQVSILSASNRARDDFFGYSVALTDEYALVGSQWANPGSLGDAGCAYVFFNSGSLWVEQAIITASDKSSGSEFGRAVALTNNYALVGARYADPGLVSSAGAAYIYTRSSSAWTQQAILTASNKAVNDLFGSSVALLDTHALVGLNSISIPRSYLYTRNGTVWTEHQILPAAAGDRCVALAGNYAMVRKNIFTRTGDNWVVEAVLNRFGNSLAITGDYAIVGYEYSNAGGLAFAGEVYFFMYESTKSQTMSRSLSRTCGPTCSFSRTSSRSNSRSRTVSKSPSLSRSSSLSKPQTSSKSKSISAISRSSSQKQTQTLVRSWSSLFSKSSGKSASTIHSHSQFANADDKGKRNVRIFDSG